MSKRQISKTVQTGMPGGEYTNIIDGSKVTVTGDGTATININNQGSHSSPFQKLKIKFPFNRRNICHLCWL